MLQTIWKAKCRALSSSHRAIKIHNNKNINELLHKEFKALKSDTKTQSTQMVNVCMRKRWGASRLQKKEPLARVEVQKICVCVFFFYLIWVRQIKSLLLIGVTVRWQQKEMR